MIGYEEQLSCVERELRLRKKLYPRKILDGRLTAFEADRELKRMEAVVETIRGLAQSERLLSDEPQVRR